MRGRTMKVLRKPKVVNRFEASISSFRAAFDPKPISKNSLNLQLATIVANQVSYGAGQWLESILEIWHQGAVVFNEAGEIIQTTEFTEKMLEKYFPDSEFAADRLPEAIEEWMAPSRFSDSDDDVVLSGDPFIVDLDGDELRIQLIVDNASLRKTLLFKETLQIKPSALMKLGLTKRESEVLFLITKGKTNPEIGLLLEISKRTVQKHVEHIYVKLGVETRTAAMLRVHEMGFEVSP
ncbi:MAG: response regulator transcription factor [Pyrinomonadaceae bacterium]|nr:response regulator transcription factor [Pyrinomonadaceae bacterium]